VPNKKSAIKRMRTSKKSQVRNRMTRSAMRTAVRRVDDAIIAGNASEAEQALPDAMARVCKAEKKGLVHKNNVARKMSRLMRAINRTKAAAAGSAQ
jgi:small subunit ribosomal protein S20